MVLGDTFVKKKKLREEIEDNNNSVDGFKIPQPLKSTSKRLRIPSISSELSLAGSNIRLRL